MLELRSTAFEDGGEIPTRYTCEGEDVSPPLRWSGVPEATRSFALVVDDPDAPRGTWVHWVVADLPESVRELPEGAASSGLPGSGRMGRNDWGRAAYGGPCPPSGRHRYVHTLYALDTVLPGRGEAPTKEELLRAIEGHVLDEARLVATYARKGNGRPQGR